MSAPFAWFDATSANPSDASDFLENMFGWKQVPVGGATMIKEPSGEMPFAATVAKIDDVQGWVPYVAVENVDDATAKAVKLGATLIRARTKGPAGEYTVVAIPGGPHLALWKRG